MTEQMIFSQRIKLPYRYTAGTAQRAALEGFGAGVLRGSRCENCAIVLAPARPFCPRCSQATGEAVDLGQGGVVEGWTVRNREGAQTTFGLIKLDGADTVLMHRLEVDQSTLANGLRVKPRWAGEKKGEITDIEAFVAE